MPIQKTGAGYYVEGRNGWPGRSPGTLREAQAYEREMDSGKEPPPLPWPNNAEAWRAEQAAKEAAKEAAKPPLDLLTEISDRLAEVVAAYLESVAAGGVLHAEMSLRRALTAYTRIRSLTKRQREILREMRDQEAEIKAESSLLSSRSGKAWLCFDSVREKTIRYSDMEDLLMARVIEPRFHDDRTAWYTLADWEVS
jgi:hypothetical protein